MPEGHTLHRLARDHDAMFAGKAVTVTSPQLRFDGADLVNGQVLTRAHAYGKHLFHDYATGMSVHVHLGLFGRFFTHEVPPPQPRDTVRMRVQGDEHAVDLVGATMCELLAPDEVAAIIDRLGPDPLRPDAEPDKAFAALQRRRVGIGRALMDQAVLAGVATCSAPSCCTWPACTHRCRLPRCPARRGRTCGTRWSDGCVTARDTTAS